MQQANKDRASVLFAIVLIVAVVLWILGKITIFQAGIAILVAWAITSIISTAEDEEGKDHDHRSD